MSHIKTLVRANFNNVHTSSVVEEAGRLSVTTANSDHQVTALAQQLAGPLGIILLFSLYLQTRTICLTCNILPVWHMSAKSVAIAKPWANFGP